MNQDKLKYTTIVNETYIPLLEKFLLTHQLFCRIQLLVFTVNFEYTGKKFDSVEFIKFTDDNIIEYQKSGDNFFIKSDSDLYKYVTLLKPKIIKKYLEKSEHFLFVDCDSLFTKNSDILFMSLVNEFVDTEIPISVNFFHQFCNHGNNEQIYNFDGTFNINSLTYYPICKLYNIDPNIIHYFSTYCMYYSKRCYNFLDEAVDVCFNGILTTNYDLYLPLGDETVINFLYSKYNFSKGISSFLCYDIPYFLELEQVLENLSKVKETVSFIHTKRFLNRTNMEKGLSESDYTSIINSLCSSSISQSKTLITDYVRDMDNNIENIFFVPSIKDEDCEIKIVSIFRPGQENYYQLFLSDGFNFFIQKNLDKITKDLYMIIYQEKKILDCTKI